MIFLWLFWVSIAIGTNQAIGKIIVNSDWWTFQRWTPRQKGTNGWMKVTAGILPAEFASFAYPINGNSRILKWRYVSTIFLAIFCGDISLHRPYIGLIYGRYLQFRFLKWPLTQPGKCLQKTMEHHHENFGKNHNIINDDLPYVKLPEGTYQLHPRKYSQLV